MPKSRCSAATVSTRWSSIKISPWVRGSSPARQLSAVDFPQPDGPSRAMNSPARTVRSRSTSASRPPKLRPTPRSSSWENVLVVMSARLVLPGTDLAVPDVEGLDHLLGRERRGLRLGLDELVVPVTAELGEQVLALLRREVERRTLDRRTGVEVPGVEGHRVDLGREDELQEGEDRRDLVSRLPVRQHG